MPKDGAPEIVDARRRCESVQRMNWLSMNMGFTVNDKALMDKLAKDKKVDFEFKQEGRDYVVTSVK